MPPDESPVAENPRRLAEQIEGRKAEPAKREIPLKVDRPSGSSLNVAMLTVIECLDRATELEDRAEQSGDLDLRASLMEVAQGWRRLAVRAYAQDVLRPLVLKVRARNDPSA
jgi:hypothetical protein